MKNYKILIGSTILALFFCWLFYNNILLRESLAQNQYAQTKILYSGQDRADQAVVEEIQNAKHFVHFAVYTLTKENIASAIIAAKLRGLEVRGILDLGQSEIKEEKPWLTKFKNYGIEIKTPLKESGLMHIKMLVTDQAYATGSFNWTTSGTYYNDEVLEVGQIQSFHQKYLEIFKTLWKKY